MTTKHCPQCGAQLVAQARFCRECGTPIQSSRAKKRPRHQSKRKSTRVPLLLLATSAILLIGVGLFTLLNRPASVAEIPDSHDESGLPYPEVGRITLAQTKAGSEQGTSLIVDVRSREEYQEAHITGAVSMPLAEMESRYRELPKDAEIVTYCS